MKEKKSRCPQKKRTNLPIMAVTYLFTAVFVSMMVYICYYSATHKQELINNSYNGRQQVLTAKNIRGTIYAGGGEILAQTVTDEEGKEERNYPYGNLFSHAVAGRSRSAGKLLSDPFQCAIIRKGGKRYVRGEISGR